MKSYGTMTLLLAIVLAAGVAVILLRENDAQRADHYIADKPQTQASAIAQLRATLEQTTSIVDQAQRDRAQRIDLLEAIHEHSYALENATDYLLQHQNANPAIVEALDEAVQALHYASEKHNLAETMRWHKVVVDQTQALTQLDYQPTASAQSAQKNRYHVAIKNHRFTPESIVVPSGQKLQLLVDNQDPTPEEFESHDLAREKIIAGRSQAIIRIGPLSPGRYHFFGEFHMDTANGYVIAQ